MREKCQSKMTIFNCYFRRFKRGVQKIKSLKKFQKNLIFMQENFTILTMRHIFGFRRNARKPFENAGAGGPDAPFSRNCARSGSTAGDTFEVFCNWCFFPFPFSLFCSPRKTRDNSKEMGGGRFSKKIDNLLLYGPRLERQATSKSFLASQHILQGSRGIAVKLASKSSACHQAEEHHLQFRLILSQGKSHSLSKANQSTAVRLANRNNVRRSGPKQPMSICKVYSASTRIHSDM